MSVFKKVSCIILLITILVFPQITSLAEPYDGYNYNVWGQSVPSPNGYLPIKTILGEELGVGSFNNPQDMFVDENKDLYLMDSGNNRIVVFDSDLKLKRIINTFKSDKGNETLNNASGIFVTLSGQIVIADTGNARVLFSDQFGNILKIIERPKSDIIPKDLNYQPKKVIVTSTNFTYVLAYGMYRGAFVFDPNGDFKGFYGSNRVEPSIAVLADMAWKRILTKEQRSKMQRFVPEEYSNFDVDNEDFIYTATMTSQNSSRQIKKLNAKSVNILRGKRGGNGQNYGDLETALVQNKNSNTLFVDINIDEDGFINALDLSQGRIFQYDQESNRLFIFGGLSSRVGTFANPVAIESINGKIIVLDSKKNNISLFKLTPFGESVHKAVQLYNQGFYQEALGPWNEVLRRDINYELAYTGIGKALMKTNNNREAMKYFKLGNDKVNYSDAFKEYRTTILEKYFSLFMFSVLMVILFPMFIVNRRKIFGFFQKLKKKGGRFKKYV